MPSSIHPSQPGGKDVCPKIVVVPTPSSGEPIASTRRAGLLLSEASRFGEALKICRPLETSTANASTQNQWLARVTKRSGRSIAALGAAHLLEYTHQGDFG